jgi:putative ABC transport system permease protein
MLAKIAARNLLRNRRRSLMTLLAVGVGALAIVLFGGFIGFFKAALETNAVQTVGHLTLYRTGYFEYGAGNPAAFAIDDYPRVIALIRGDPAIAPALDVVTPTVSLMGIAGNFEVDASKTFLGAGFIPSDRDRMRVWDEHLVFLDRPPIQRLLRDDDESSGVVGLGLARVLGLCERLRAPDCHSRPRSAEPAPSPDPGGADLTALAAAERGPAQASAGDSRPRIDLLAATAGGAPNVVSLFVAGAEHQAAKELDENYVAMNFTLAQKLLFGHDARKAVAVVLQLRRTEDLAKVRARLEELIRQNHLDLEIRDFAERQPFYEQSVRMFNVILVFIALIMGVIVLFTVVNTMGMAVMERTNEIGTVRALGVRRSGARRMFLLEGALLGLVGSTAGILSARLVAGLFNAVGVRWTPPGNSSPVLLQVMTRGTLGLNLGIWAGLILVATLAAVVPANRAARLKVVDALRHV